MKSHKGQAAMEFLMTYGWAILVLLVAIGALAYFGVLNPRNYLPDQCVSTPGIGCKDHLITTGGSGQVQLKLAVENKRGESIIVRGYNVTNYGSTMVTINSGCTLTPAVNANVAPDATLSLDCPIAGTTSPGAGQSAKLVVTLIYQEFTGVYNQTATIEVKGKVQ